MSKKELISASFTDRSATDCSKFSYMLHPLLPFHFEARFLKASCRMGVECARFLRTHVHSYVHPLSLSLCFSSSLSWACIAMSDGSIAETARSPSIIALMHIIFSCILSLVRLSSFLSPLLVSVSLSICLSYRAFLLWNATLSVLLSASVLFHPI